MRPATVPLVVEGQQDETDGAGEWDRKAPELVATFALGDLGAAALPEFLRQFSPSLLPSLLGTVEARAPGVPGSKLEARLGRVRVAAKVDHGFVYTEVEEELVNDANVQVEAVASFRAPPSGVITRMGLWVDERLIDAEVVERKRAADVFDGIVQRSRDPALLEQEPSRAVKLRVFPVPAHGSRRVIVGYVQPLERRDGRYSFELGLGLAEGAPPIRELSVDVELAGVTPEQLVLAADQPAALVQPGKDGTRLSWQKSRISPSDWRVSFEASAEPLAEFVPVNAAGAERFVALRVAPELPSKLAERDASVWLIDTSVGQNGAALDVSKVIVASLLRQLPTGEPFAILACDTACASFPRRGLMPATSESRRDAQRFVAALAARGASDVGYALLEALRRAQARPRTQLVYFGDARPTAGDLDADELEARLAGSGELLDLRLVGVGAALTTSDLSELAARFDAARTTIGGGTQQAETVARWLAQPVLRSPSLGLPSAFESAYPRRLPNLVRGDEQLVLARLGRAASGALRGQLSGVFDSGAGLELRRSELGFALSGRERRADGVPRLWAHARLAELDEDERLTAYNESVELSKRYQVLSHYTSFLALESDAMFRDFGIEQRFGRADFGRPPVRAPAPRAAPQSTHRVRAPVIRMSVTTVSGRVPPEVIQTTVRRNDGRFRACYHEGLLRNPALEGKVTTRFLIGRDGTVARSMDSGSTLPDRAVIDCIVRTFRTLTFPVADDVITVIYPFVLSPSTEREERLQPTPASFHDEPPLARLAPAQSPHVESPARVSAAELAAQVELDPTNVALQLGAAHAYEAEHNERRACAHFRAAATLAPLDLDAQYQALRCRARVLDERVSVLADVARLDLHSPSIDALVTTIRSLGQIPAFVPHAPLEQPAGYR